MLISNRPGRRTRALLSLTIVSAMMVSLLISPSSASRRAAPPSHGEGVSAIDGRAKTPPAKTTSSEPAAEVEARAREAYGNVEMSFEENRGQTADEVRFLARGAGYTLFLTPTEAVFVLARQSDVRGEAARRKQLLRGGGETPLEAAASTPPAVLRMKLEGATSRPVVSGRGELEGKVNYFIGDDAAKWHTNIPTFGRVHYAGVYEGVDMVYYGNQQQLEYDFVVRPGADYAQIALSFEGADKIEVDAASGDLLLSVGEGTLRQQKPFVYQEVDGARREVESGYEWKRGGRIGFRVGEHDRARPLVIDPVLAYSTFLGGSSGDFGNGVAVDAAGNAYITGRTNSENFPTVNATGISFGINQDAYVTKLNASGSALVYSTYLGGNSIDTGNGIAVDSAGNAYVTGRTNSDNFPTGNAIDNSLGGTQDAYVTKLNASGSVLIYSTYLGGSSDDSGSGIAVDSAGNAYVAGQTDSTDFPVTPDAFQPGKDAGTSTFVSKLGSFVIGGRVVDSAGNPIAAVTVTLSGSNSALTTTDANGNFVFLDTTPNGNFTVTPAAAGFTFSPQSITVNELNTNQSLIFVGTTTGTAPTPTPTPTPTPSQTPATFGFSAASFAVSESAGKFQIIVTRSGDTTSAAAVDYSTTDGTANDRGDYTTAIGRLRFAAGETARSFNIFITDDAFAEGNETVQITLSNPSAGAQLGGMTTTLLSIVDNETVTGAANPIDATTFFVRQHYVDFLNREPDASGLAFWTNNIESCGADSQCREARRIDTSAAFFLSIEFQETGFLVHRATRAAFNRLARYREFLRDTQELGRNVVVGQPGFGAQLEANKQAFFAEFVTRAEFTAIYAGLTNEQYVDALNVNTGNSLSAPERDALVAGLNAMTETRATVLRKVAEDADFSAREFNQAFVLAEYFGYLRRNPDDAPDSNFDGFNFWLQKLEENGGDFRRAQMVQSFIESLEYRGRFGQP